VVTIYLEAETIYLDVGLIKYHPYLYLYNQVKVINLNIEYLEELGWATSPHKIPFYLLPLTTSAGNFH